MTIIEELLKQIELDKMEAGETPEEWGDGVFEMPFSAARALITIAEAAFKIPEMIRRRPERDFCEFCRGTMTPYGRESYIVIHNDNCPWKCIQDGKRELERVPKESA